MCCHDRRQRKGWKRIGYRRKQTFDSIIKLTARPGNLPFPASGPLAEHRRVGEERERLDILENTQVRWTGIIKVVGQLDNVRDREDVFERRVTGEARIFSDLARNRALRSDLCLVNKNFMLKKKGCDHTPRCFSSLLVTIHPIEFLVPNNLLDFSFFRGSLGIRT